ncbi:MAG: ShlB/FhaC/HecB family hemolysin secretion/activation protein [Betaproteobacteria bacterium]|nr:ShlB/FhaC/HecB family hemolysin secretion/activation protein [Betaproteobacteria bacterium]
MFWYKTDGQILPAIRAAGLSCLSCAVFGAIAAALVFGLAWPSFAATPADGESESAQPAFDVLEYRVEGNTVLSERDIGRAVYPHLGTARNIEDVRRAADALERAYQSAGYLTVLVEIPQQRVDSGVVTLQVTEGAINRLRVRGAKYFSAGEIREEAVSMKEGTVPNFPRVQEDLARLNRRPDRKITPVLKQAPVPGFVDIDLKVEDKLPLHGSVEINNRYIANTEPLRLSAAVRYDNLWGLGHSAGVQLLTSPEDTSQVRVLSANYAWTPGGNRNLLAVFATKSLTDIATSPTLGVVGRGNIVGARYIMPTGPRGTLSQLVTLGADYKDFSETTSFGPGGAPVPISYVPLTAQYGLQHRGEKGNTSANLGVTFGMRDWFGNGEAEFQARQQGASASYASFRTDLQREQFLPRGFSAKVRFQGQASSGTLVTTEQFFLSGVDGVRGYLEGEVIGDDAYLFRLEAISPSMASAAGNALRDLKALVFYDAGEAYVHRAFQRPSSTRVSGAGIGLRAQGTERLSASLDLAWPLNTPPCAGTCSSDATRAGEPRVQFRVAYDF